MRPTTQGLEHYVLRLSERDTDNQTLWKQLPPLAGMSRMGRPKRVGTVVLARAGDAGNGAPVLVGQEYGKGRVLAFAGDTTYRWRTLGLPDTRTGVEAHARFWKQVMLWLARQEQSAGYVWVKPELRRLPAGSKLDFSVGLRGKTGKELPTARFEVSVENPQKVTKPVPTARREANGEERGAFLWTETPGEYRLLVKGSGKDVDGSDISGTAESRFLVYHDETELAQQAADHQFLRDLATEGGGQFHRAEELETVLDQLEQRLPISNPTLTAQLHPNWRPNQLSGFLVGYFLLFVFLICLEWFLRRSWGLV
jgi:hypothetical protein